MRSTGIAVVVACLLSAPGPLSAGQGGGNQMQAPPVPVLVSPPPINRPLSIFSPVPPINRPLGLEVPSTSPFAAPPGTFTTLRPVQQFFAIPLAVGFGAPVFFVGDTTRQSPQAPVRSEDLRGVLFLDVTPRTALVFIDTAYVGSVDDLLFSGIRLSPGRHLVELTAPEYEPKTLEIQITAGQPLRYRADLTPIRRAALTVAPPPPPQTMYAIPGCYGGNRPPDPARLPAGCDIARVRVLRPQQR